MTNDSYVLVGLGPMRPALRAVWESQPEIAHVHRFERAAPGGRRLGKRALGLGLDSVIVALTAVVRHPRARFVAANPWIALPLIALGRDVATTGIYAERGTRSWRVLRKVIGRRPVVTTVRIESDEWNLAGGNSGTVLYGTSFDLVCRKVRHGEPIRIFVGGTSDRDAALIDRLIAEVAAATDVELVVADGQHRRHVVDRITSPGWVDQDTFGQLIRESDVALLPLRPGQRAAGHMVTVAALEAGVPVVTTPSVGMRGYVAAPSVTEIPVTDSFLADVVAVARQGRDSGPGPYRDRWESQHAPTRNVRAVLDEITRLRAEDPTVKR